MTSEIGAFPGWYYLAGSSALIALILAVGAIAERARPNGLKPPVDSGKF